MSMRSPSTRFPYVETTGLSLGRVIERFDIEFLEEAAAFVNTLPAKTKDKVLYNMQKARVLNDPELFLAGVFVASITASSRV